MRLPAINPTELEVAAMKALAAGVANAGQQKTALRFILNTSGVRDMSVDLENDRVTVFNEGRRFVGWQIAKLIELVGVTTDTQKEDNV